MRLNAVIVVGLLLPLPAVANELVLEGCKEECEIVYAGSVDDYVSMQPRRSNSNSGKGKSTFVQVLADAAGQTITSVSAMLDTASQQMADAGYTHYTGTLHHKDGSQISFTYSFATKNWSMRKSHSNSGADTGFQIQHK